MTEKKRTWICPNDGTYNSGNFCIRCGCPCAADEKAECSPTVQSAALSAAESHVAEAEIGLLFEEAESEETVLQKLQKFVTRLWEQVSAHKKPVLVCSSALILFLLFGFFVAPRIGVCVFGHKWQASDCLHPMTCSVCGKVSGSLGKHRFAPATCTEASVCTVCGAVSGDALGHDWKDATCTEPMACSRCGITEGEPNGHIEGRASVLKSPDILESGEEEVLCKICGQSMGVRSCELTSYVAGDSFLFSGRDYMRLLLDGIEHCLPDGNVIVLTDKETGEESFNLWTDGDNERINGKAAYAVLYDLDGHSVPIDEGEQLCPASVCWNFTDPDDTEGIKKILPFILYTVSPDPIDAEELFDKASVTTGELCYRYENDGDVARLTVETHAAEGSA